MPADDAPPSSAPFLDVHLMLLAGRARSRRRRSEIITEQHCNAEWALTAQLDVLVEQFDEIEDAYLRERKADVEQVVERVLKRLLGKPGRRCRAAPPRRQHDPRSRTTSRPPT